MAKKKINVIKGEVLGVKVYRGFAELSLLSKISKADIYDQKTNPTGTQRDLSPKHAREAYLYVKTQDFAFWPEVMLNLRIDKYVKFKSIKNKYGELTIDFDQMLKDDNIIISRVDGNHRLHFAGGDFKGFPELTTQVSFCLAYDLPIEKEISLFRDINNNQKRMNTSHLDNIEARLTPEEVLKSKDPDLFIANELGKDDDSVLFGRVYEGGKSLGKPAIPLRTLRTGIKYMLSRPSKLTALKNADAQYRVIKNYFKALKKWEPEAWEHPKNYIILRGVGLWAVCFIGADVIDRTLTQGDFAVDSMVKVLKSGRKWDWSSKGDFDGYSGRGGAVKISDIVTSEFQEDGKMSVSDLFNKIMKE